MQPMKVKIIDGTGILTWRLPFIMRLYVIFSGDVYVSIKGTSKDPNSLDVKVSVIEPKRGLI